MTRAVIVEDLPLLRDGLVRLLSANGFEVTAAVDSGPALLRAVEEQDPDVAVVDVRLPRPASPMRACVPRSRHAIAVPASPS